MLNFKYCFSSQKNELKNKKTIAAYIIFGIILLLGLVLISVVWWSVGYFGVGIEQILVTMTAPLKGANSGVVVADAFKSCLPIICPPLFIYVLLVVIDIKFGERIRLRRFFRICCSLICVATFITSLFYANDSYSLIEYIKTKNDTTTIYEDYYVDPNTVNITGDNTKNLICIYLESLENSYSSLNEGGFQNKNLIPKLTELADDNISFSSNEKLGGFHTVTGTTFTMGSIFALNSGIPYTFPVKYNLKNKSDNFASGTTTLGDILNSNGYALEFLCGSDADFGSRRDFFKSHGNYKIFDYYSSIDSGYIDESYHEFWGIEDQKLYQIAKDELIKLSSSGKPFNFSMLTVDTHFPSGYECELCENQHQEKAANVVSCADRQINDFIDWCKNQEFYEDTVIVVLGDHPRMEQVLVPDGFENEPRTVYNCIINSAQAAEGTNYKNRIFTAMDYFPTILAAMGFNIEGERLGLGTNLLSGKQTLIEELGLKIEDFNNELSKYSAYYIKNFS